MDYRLKCKTYLWLIHVDAWLKPIQYYKAIILQLKINNFFKNCKIFRKTNRKLSLESWAKQRGTKEPLFLVNTNFFIFKIYLFLIEG